MTEDIITMSQKELKRLHVIRKVIDGELYQVEAAGLLSLSPRQISRLAKRVRLEGNGGVAHKSRGRSSGRRFPEEIKERVIRLYRERYHDFGPTFASEKLLERDGIKLSDETLRKWLMESGDWRKARKRKTHRKWRERKACFGEMLQMDGSHHDWLEGRAPKMVLMGYIDDATNNVYGRFYEYEGTVPAMDSFKRYVRRRGVPQSVYLDRHTTYKSPAKPTIEDDLNDRKAMSQFERALNELGVKVIHAMSPQAKGRVERLFGTLQDRLVKEMRLKGIKDMAKANRFLEGYLPKYNKRFGVSAAMDTNLHRPVPEGFDLDGVLRVKTERALRNDFTVAHEGRLYQVFDCVNAKKVMVEERLNGRTLITLNNRALRFKEIQSRPLPEKPLKPFKIRKKHSPPKDHPWRKFPLTPKPDIS
ncbi:MAG: ISNCY family transposase, partial [Deltaproteobacteria bacterium]